MIEAPVNNDIDEIKGLLQVLISEIQELRRQRLPANAAEIETLLKAIYIFFPGTAFTSSWLLEYAIDSDPQSVQLFKAIKAVLTKKPTVNRLSRFFRKSIGIYGGYRLEMIDPHSRDGCLFRVSIVSDYVTT